MAVIDGMTAYASLPPAESLDALLWRQAELRPDAQAYVFLDDNLDVARSLTFAQLADKVPALAGALADRAAPGDRVLLAFNNGLDAIEAFWACLLAGLVPIPAPAPDLRHSRVAVERLTGIAGDARVVLAVTSDDLVPQARDHAAALPWATLSELLQTGTGSRGAPGPEHANGAATAYLQYTSGSTSAPRGVELTHAGVLAQCRALDEAVPLDLGRDRGLIWLPWFHDYGLIHGLIAPMYAGVPSFLMPTLSFMRHPLRWLNAIDRHRITLSGAPNFAYAACVQALSRSPEWSGRLDTLRVASCGAEPVRRETLEAFTAAFTPFGFSPKAFAPSYGLAEAVLAVTVTPVDRGPRYLHVQTRALEQHRVVLQPEADERSTELVSCGPPLPGFEVRVVDPASRVACPPDAVGEIWVSGDSIGHGYWYNAAATEQTFAARLAGFDESQVTCLRTGDLGFLHDGELFITGRRKDLLVVHGRNVYPQDLERTAEAAHEGVRASGAIAIGITAHDGHEAVALLVECRGRPEPAAVAEISESVRRQVAAEHEIEVAQVVAVRSGTLPRTSSGKPQRSAARQMLLNGDFTARSLQGQAPAAPPQQHDAVFQRLRDIWSEVLGMDDPGDDANFFELGGDSLLATQIVSRLNDAFAIDLPIRCVFETPTLAGLAALARSAERRAPAAQPGQSSERALSFAQERMWFMHELAPESTAYNIPLAIRFRGPLDLPALQSALNQEIDRHDILRTRFVSTSDGPRAEPAHGMPPPVISQTDLRAHLGDRLSEARKHLAALVSAPFRLDQPPLMRVGVIRISDDEAIVLWVLHHIIGDQWSCAVLGREMSACYLVARTGGAAALPPLPLQYADYAQWHRNWFSGERRRRQLDYWRGQLDGLEPLQLNEDFPRPPQQTFRGAAIRRPLGDARIDALTRIGAAHGASLGMVMITALKVLLMRHCRTEDIAIGVPIANRHHLSSENLIGTFVNTLVFRTDLSGADDFAEALRRVRTVALDAFAHQDMPFEVLVRELDLPPDLSRSPLFDVMFNMINTPARDLAFPDLEWSRVDFDRGAAQFDLSINVDAMYDGAIVFEYATSLFAADTMERLADHYFRVLDAAIDSADKPIRDYDLLGDEEAALLRQWGQGRELATDRQTVNQLLAQAAARTPEAQALIFNGWCTSYAELEGAANRLARELRRRGMGRGKTLGICLPRSHDMLVAVLAALKSGAAYVPLDPAYPKDRLAFQADDAGIALLLATTATAGHLNRPHEQVLLLDQDAGEISLQPSEPLASDPLLDAVAEDPAYIIYTSGSTGVPKGVAVPHRALVNFLRSMRDEPGLSADDRLLAVTTLGFDIAVLELLLPLTVGATVVLASDGQAGDGEALAALMEQHQITVMQATPSRWHLLIESGWSARGGLKALCGGEALSESLASQLLSRGVELWNMYGPTETTVWSSCCRISPEPGTPVSLGRPIANTQIQVVDALGRPCPIGVPGEICIGGSGLALGYLNQPEVTKRRFTSVTAKSIFPGRAIYRTGDRGRWRFDGMLEHLGRLDDQVKLRGYRIEPGEIEAHLAGHDSVSRAVVVVREDRNADPHLAAYIVAKGSSQNVDSYRAHLRQWLPEHMVPRHFITIPAIPTLPNGKVNRRALPPPEAQSRSQNDFELPRSPLEHSLMSIWQGVLGVEEFSIHDNFFDLGGHSIMAVRAVQRIKDQLDLSCPLALMFHRPTVAGLAETLETKTLHVENDIVVELLASGPLPALFCLSGTEMYREMTTGLARYARLYGLISAQELGLIEGSTTLPDVTVLAKSYVDAIRRMQPTGPYQLVGFSIGGVIAFEVAQQIRDSGEEISLLALVDSSAPGFGWRHAQRWFKKRFLQLPQLRMADLTRLLGRVWGVDGAEDGLHSSVYSEYARVIRRYQAKTWDQNMLFIQACDDPVTEPGYGWQSYAPKVRVKKLPGKHMGLIHGSSALSLAGLLRAQIASSDH